MDSKAPSAAGSSADVGAVRDAVQGMYAAAAARDFEAARRFFAPGFYIFDLGVRYDGDAILAQIERGQEAGATYRWEVTEPEVGFAGDMAWIAYVNRGGITNDGVEAPVTWLESAVLRYDAGRWLIVFMHSTRAPATSPS
jgi:ketosteroid isomerase-like protein